MTIKFYGHIIAYCKQKVNSYKYISYCCENIESSRWDCVLTVRSISAAKYPLMAFCEPRRSTDNDVRRFTIFYIYTAPPLDKPVLNGYNALVR